MNGWAQFQRFHSQPSRFGDPLVFESVAGASTGAVAAAAARRGVLLRIPHHKTGSQPTTVHIYFIYVQ